MQIDPRFKLTKFREYPEYEQTPEYLDYRDDWNIAPQTGFTTDFPLNIDVEVSRVCSLKCPFCPREVMPPTELKGYFDFELYKSIFRKGHIPKNMRGYIPKAMKFNWLGEPLYHKKLVDFIEYAKDQGVIETSINTNGVLLTREKSKELIHSNLDRIIFSIDTIDPEKYRNMRVGAELNNVVGNILLLLQQKEMERVWHPIIRVQKIDMAETRDEDFEEFWEAIGVDEVSHISYKEKDKSKSDFKPKPCAQPFQRLLIDVYGKMHLCCADYHDEYVVGDLSQGDTIYNTWHSTNAEKLRILSIENKLEEIEMCRSCETTK